jgi:hypothetical protein
MSTKRHTARNFRNINNRFNSANLAAIVAGTRLSYNIAYMAVGGGGAGGSIIGQGYPGGGGGAGGFLQGNALVSQQSVLTITIGAGAITPDPSASNYGAGGGNTTITGSLTVTANGGGTGAIVYGPGLSGGKSDGGSGGGASRDAYGFPAGIAFGSPGVGVAGSQGYPGGPQPSPLSPIGGSGGGGAAGAGAGLDEESPDLLLSLFFCQKGLRALTSIFLKISKEA